MCFYKQYIYNNKQALSKEDPLYASKWSTIGIDQVNFKQASWEPQNYLLCHKYYFLTSIYP